MAEPFTLPRIKVCGLTEVADALAAVEAGCDAVGLVEYPPSPRSIERERAREIAAALPPRVCAVAVMVDRQPEHAERWLAATGARAVQLCGGEDPAHWWGFPHAILRRVAVRADAEAEIEAWREVAVGFVLDHPSLPGGSGREVAIERAAQLCALAPCLLAGGLDEHNVAERVEAARPWGVDVSSRLELAPGRKDTARVALFVRRAREALSEHQP